ncbi:MAG: hypothetical protein A2451_05695 [Bdellovibrionales bacterium RIFOXYC2_FULL_39_8]|nr:MAG: hypothetical protein A2451_05695 [Bdellovibrionales bacterium RIFOXYC2_FULL_39_8]
MAVAKSYLNPSVYTGPNQTSPTWDGKTSCTSCHDYGPSYPNRSPKANSHARHLGLFSNPHTPNSDPNPCHICHYTTTTDGKTITNKANHVNRKYDVVPNTNVTFHQNSNTAYPVTFTYSYDPGGGSCSNISCHTNLISKTHAWGLPQTVTQSLYYTAGNSCGDVILHEGASGGVPPYTYHIDWESDGVIDHVGPNILITHTYNDTSAGKTITSFARDANASKSGIRTTTVSFTTTTNVLPTVSISLSIVGQTVTITDQSFDPDYNACGHHENPPTNYSHAIIDWGPGSYIHYPFNQPLTNTPAGQQFSFVYPGPGKYLIYYGVYDNVISYPEFHDPISVTIE